MLTKTTVSAIRALIHLGLHGSGGPISPRRIAEQLGESPTYLAKVMRLLVKAGILRAHFGMAGGVVLHRSPESITLLAITEACQGTLLANLCTETDNLAGACAFHQAGAELHRAITGVMSRWTLAGFLSNPSPSPRCERQIRCWMQPLDEQSLVKLTPGTGRKSARSKGKADGGKGRTRV
jgi:Rrf2 family transcriptional regulator, nitric oxide-sensitive transcriptional repressor